MTVLAPALSMGIQALEERVLIALVRAAWVASSSSNCIVRKAGLSPSQYNVLRILRHAGNEGLTRTEISERMVTGDSDLTRILSGLAAMGSVRTHRSADDRRRLVSRITPGGAAILQELDHSVQEAATTSLSNLSVSELRQLHKLLEAIRPVAAS